MPELPEVETVVRQLNEHIAGSTIIDLDVYFGKRMSPDEGEFVDEIKGRTIKQVNRRSKIIHFDLSDDLNLLVHLKMTGFLFLMPKKTEAQKHTHVVFKLNGDYDIHWADIRKFGYLKLMNDQETAAWFTDKKFGPEPLTDEFTVKSLIENLKRHPKSNIKTTLLNQSVVSGLGNIYVCEVLWQTKIHPLKRVNSLKDKQIRSLHRAIIKTLQSSVDAGGTSSDTYRDSFGHKGSFGDQLDVYGRAGAPCHRCKTPLDKIKVNGRGTVFCSQCQI